MHPTYDFCMAEKQSLMNYHAGMFNGKNIINACHSMLMVQQKLWLQEAATQLY
jgi:hypothetical protein